MAKAKVMTRNLYEILKELMILQKCSKRNRLFFYLSLNSGTMENENAQSYL